MAISSTQDSCSHNLGDLPFEISEVGHVRSVLKGPRLITTKQCYFGIKFVTIYRLTDGLVNRTATSFEKYLGNKLWLSDRPADGLLS